MCVDIAVLVDFLPSGRREAVIGISPVRDVHRAAEIAEKRGRRAAVPRGAIRTQRKPSISSARGTPKRSRKVGAISIDCVSAASAAAARVWGIVDEQRDVRDLLVEIHAVLGPEIMLAEQKPVIGGHHSAVSFHISWRSK